MGKAAATDDVEAVRQHDWTAGCIALTDAEMDVLREAVDVPVPIRIVP